MNMEEIIALQKRGKHSLVLSSELIMTFDGKGVKDLYRLLSLRPQLLRGAKLADKVVGKGAAALMVLGGVSQVYAQVISRPALDMLVSSGIQVDYAELVPHISNRAGDGLCPVETLCADCLTAAECLPRIEAFLGGMGLDRRGVSKVFGKG